MSNSALHTQGTHSYWHQWTMKSVGVGEVEKAHSFLYDEISDQSSFKLRWTPLVSLSRVVRLSSPTQTHKHFNKFSLLVWLRKETCIWHSPVLCWRAVPRLSCRWWSAVHEENGFCCCVSSFYNASQKLFNKYRVKWKINHSERSPRWSESRAQSCHSLLWDKTLPSLIFRLQNWVSSYYKLSCSLSSCFQTLSNIFLNGKTRLLPEIMQNLKISTDQS